RRRPLGLLRGGHPALAHPLKILVGVAAPPPELGGGAPIGEERQLEVVLAAVEEQARIGRAQVRILEVASLEALGAALERDAYHVVHIVAHGAPGAILLEDEDGAAVEVQAAALARTLARSGAPVPLVVLSA